MLYKLKTNRRAYLFEDNRKHSDKLIFPRGVKKFRFWLWLFNPRVEVYIFRNNKWESVFSWEYRRLI